MLRAVSGSFAIRVTGIGHALYASSVAGLGGLLLSGTFVDIFAPLPSWVSWRDGLSCAWGALMLVSAIALLWKKTVVPSSGVVALVFLSWLLFLQVPELVAEPEMEVLWSGASQLVALAAGGLLLFASRASPVEGPGRWFRGDRGVRIARLAYALALLEFGLHHFLTTGAAEAVSGVAALPGRLGGPDRPRTHGCRGSDPRGDRAAAGSDPRGDHDRRVCAARSRAGRYLRPRGSDAVDDAHGRVSALWHCVDRCALNAGRTVHAPRACFERAVDLNLTPWTRRPC